jgi:hypothetical protein
MTAGVQVRSRNDYTGAFDMCLRAPSRVHPNSQTIMPTLELGCVVAVINVNAYYTGLLWFHPFYFAPVHSGSLSNSHFELTGFKMFMLSSGDNAFKLITIRTISMQRITNPSSPWPISLISPSNKILNHAMHDENNVSPCFSLQPLDHTC